MTDFGIKDGNVGVMKGVIWGICPEARIADVSHMIGAQNVPEAALILARSAPYFPPGSIHLVVVDPGVGTARRPMAAQLGSSYYVGPDNGTITLWYEHTRAEGEEATLRALGSAGLLAPGSERRLPWKRYLRASGRAPGGRCSAA